MMSVSAFAETAALVGDPARANMLAALMDGRALTAAELARTAGVAPQTASGHLARLTQAGVLAVERQGRHRYHRLASATVAHMLESIMATAAERNDTARPPMVVGPRDAALRRARTCYDHLAGQLAVAIADRLSACGHVDLSADAGALTDEGADFLRGLHVDVEGASAVRTRRVFCRPCLDWSERRPHLAGALGAALCAAFFSQGWLRRIDGTRAVAITPPGQRAFWDAFDFRSAV